MNSCNIRNENTEPSSTPGKSHRSVVVRRAGMLTAVVFTTMLLALVAFASGRAATSTSTAQARAFDQAHIDAGQPRHADGMDVSPGTTFGSEAFGSEPQQEPSDTPDPQPTQEPYPGPTQEPYPGPTEEPYPGPTEDPDPPPQPSATATEEPHEPEPTDEHRDEGQPAPPPTPTPTPELPNGLPKTGGGGAARR